MNKLGGLATRQGAVLARNRSNITSMARYLWYSKLLITIALAAPREEDATLRVMRREAREVVRSETLETRRRPRLWLG